MPGYAKLDGHATEQTQEPLAGRIARPRRTLARTTAAALGALLLAAVAAPAMVPGAVAQEGPQGIVPGTKPLPNPVDSDGDRLFDHEERAYGLDPFNRDSDGDFLDDGDEFYDVYGQSDPTLYDTDLDSIGDGDEVWGYGTNPYDFDSDDDGRSDGTEVLRGTNPRDPKSR